MIVLVILLPMLGALAAYLAGRKREDVRDALTRAITWAEFLATAWIFLQVNALHRELALSLPGVCALGLTFRADGFRSIYALVAAFLWLITTQFSGEYFRHSKNKNRSYFFTLITLGATIGLFYSDDLYTTFVFFEIMSMASYPWVAHDETKAALRAAATYLGIAVLGGMVSLMGLFLLYHRLGTLSFSAIRAASSDASLALPAVLALFGFAAKAGAFPVHVWLPKAHPVAPAPASALLSGILTKTGMFGILAICMNLFVGNRAFGNALLGIALATMLLGAVLALFSTNLKRTLACSSMSQIGYILTGVACAVLLGEHGSLAAAGAVTHMVNHSLLKLTLFLCAGCVYMNLHALELNDVRGFGRGKPLLHFCFLMGALGLAGVPLFNGYVSKTMIHEGLAELGGAYRIPEWIFLFAAGLTTGYMLKLYIALFLQKNPDAAQQKRFDTMNRRYMNRRSALALTASAILVPLLGILPGFTLMPLARISAPFVNRHPVGAIRLFSLTNLRGGAITLIIGTLAYMFVVRKWMFRPSKGYLNRWPHWLDLEDMFYRPVLCQGMSRILCGVCSVLDKLIEGRFVSGFLARTGIAILRVFDELTDHLALMLRELLFASREEMHRTQRDSIFIRMACVCADGVYAVSRRLARKHPDERTITDMRYGTFATNAISFGLLLCAMAVLFAIVYVFSRV